MPEENFPSITPITIEGVQGPDSCTFSKEKDCMKFAHYEERHVLYDSTHETHSLLASPLIPTVWVLNLECLFVGICLSRISNSAHKMKTTRMTLRSMSSQTNSQEQNIVNSNLQYSSSLFSSESSSKKTFRKQQKQSSGHGSNTLSSIQTSIKLNDNTWDCDTIIKRINSIASEFLDEEQLFVSEDGIESSDRHKSSNQEENIEKSTPLNESSSKATPSAPRLSSPIHTPGFSFTKNQSDPHEGSSSLPRSVISSSTNQMKCSREQVTVHNGSESLFSSESANSLGKKRKPLMNMSQGSKTRRRMKNDKNGQQSSQTSTLRFHLSQVIDEDSDEEPVASEMVEAHGQASSSPVEQDFIFSDFCLDESLKVDERICLSSLKYIRIRTVREFSSCTRDMTWSPSEVANITKW